MFLSPPYHLFTNKSWGFIGVLIGVFVLFGSGPKPAQAQTDPQFYQYPQNHLDWYTLESDHFKIHFQKGSDRSARQIAVVAEDVYPGITSLYQHEPDQKVSIVLQDREDYANGAAYFFDNKIDIWVPALDTPFRGYHHWLRNVISHEFTHIVQLQAAMKRDRSMPAWYLQWLSYEDVRRPDVLYGYPNVVFTFPFSSLSIPAWMAEGFAQYQRQGWDYENWDAHRDMLLRTRILDGNYLKFDEMGTFASKNSLERELVYNQGYAFTRYLAQRFGEEGLREITQTASETKAFNIDKVMEKATGISGQQLYDDWIAHEQEWYREQTQTIQETPADTVEGAGFLNLYATYHPDGTLYYLSNRGEDYSFLHLTKHRPSGDTTSVAFADIDFPAQTPDPNYSCGFHAQDLADRFSGSFSISPNGKQMVFSRLTLNKWGENYNDLYLKPLDQPEADPTRLTFSRRISEPAFSPDAQSLVAIQERDGTQNLVRFNLETDSLTDLTDFKHGEQLFSPVWHPNGQDIYLSYGDTLGRRLYRYDLSQQQMTPLDLGWSDHVDVRDPALSPDGNTLYFSANPHGIFNIYRISLESGRQSYDPQQLTNVIGGAFMPAVSEDGQLAYSAYTSTGYKLVTTSLVSIEAKSMAGSYADQAKPFTTAKAAPRTPYPGYDALRKQPESFATGILAQAADTTIRVPRYQTKQANAADLNLQSYDGTTTDFSFFPVLRFDNYSRLNGPNRNLLRDGDIEGLAGNLWRDVKAGFYLGSREVIDRFSIFGGALFGFGSRDAEDIGDFFSPSRLVDLDRDLFFIAEYRGLPFIEKRWSPTISVELYNQRRNVKDGLSVEEFPCTSCLPDTTNTDIAYDIWEADLYLRSKINRWSLVELGLSYSPYRVTTEGFVSREFKQYVAGSTSQYFKGTTLSAGYIFDLYAPYRHSDIAPLGFRGEIKYTYQPSKLLDNYELNDGVLSPIYKTSKNHSVMLDTRYNHLLGSNLTGQVHTRLFSYLNNPDDFFYLDYIGGFSGMRSYPFYAIGGNTTAFAQLSLYTPIVTSLHRQMGRFTLDKLYLRWFAEAGNGWRGPYDTGNQLKSGIGAELRFAFSSYYLFPLKLFISGAYGLNEFSATLPDQFLTNQQDNRISYGKELLFHVGMTFDFEALGLRKPNLWR